jgi:Mrp family chromosome partitioning ATPase
LTHGGSSRDGDGDATPPDSTVVLVAIRDLRVGMDSPRLDGVDAGHIQELAASDAPLRWRGPSTDSFLWRGALETGALREFLSDIAWGELDFLLVDVPPGTDRIERLLELVPRPAALLLVTTPSAAARHVLSKSARLVK